MKAPVRLLAALLSTLVLAACAPGAARPLEVQQEPGFYLPVAPESGVAGGEESMRALDSSVFTDSAAAVERLVIRTANLSLVVKDPAASAEAITAMAEAMGGFVVSTNLFQTSYGDPAVLSTQGSITIRVPAERFQEALSRLKEDAEEVRAENVSGQDVTQQYTDLQSRLRNLEAAEAQLREIMASATKTEDVLRIFEELRRVREEIEVIKGQIQYFDESAQLSAITVELIPDAAAQPLQIGGWKPEGTAKQALEALVRGLQMLADALIWLVILGVPAAILIGLPAWAGMRAARRRRARKSTEDPRSS